MVKKLLATGVMGAALLAVFACDQGEEPPTAPIPREPSLGVGGPCTYDCGGQDTIFVDEGGMITVVVSPSAEQQSAFLSAIADMDYGSEDCDNIKNWAIHYGPSITVDLFNRAGGGWHLDHVQPNEFPSYHLSIGEGPISEYSSGELANLMAHEVVHHLYPNKTETEADSLAEQCTGHAKRVWR